MAAVSNVTEFSNSNTLSNTLSALGSPAFVKGTCMTNLMYTEDLPSQSMVRSMQKRGSLTATYPSAESTALAIDSGGELTDTKVDLTAAMGAIVSGLSVAAETFGTIDLTRLAQEQFSALARAVDTDALGLFSGLSGGRTSASLLTIDDLMLSQMTIYTSEVPNKEVQLSLVTHAKGAYGLKKEIVQSGASAFTNQSFLSILGGMPQANCYAGSIPGIADVYQTSGMGASGSDTYSALFHPMWTFAMIIGASPKSWIIQKGSEGFYTELATHLFWDVGEWNDLAGQYILSDT